MHKSIGRPKLILVCGLPDAAGHGVCGRLKVFDLSICGKNETAGGSCPRRFCVLAVVIVLVEVTVVVVLAVSVVKMAVASVTLPFFATALLDPAKLLLAAELLLPELFLAALVSAEATLVIPVIVVGDDRLLTNLQGVSQAGCGGGFGGAEQTGGENGADGEYSDGFMLIHVLCSV